MSPTPSQMTLIDTHITAIVTGVVIGGTLAFTSRTATFSTRLGPFLLASSTADLYSLSSSRQRP